MRNTCEIIHLLTDSNPIQVIVDAIINRCAAPRRPAPQLGALLVPCHQDTIAASSVALNWNVQ